MTEEQQALLLLIADTDYKININNPRSIQTLVYLEARDYIERVYKKNHIYFRVTEAGLRTLGRQ